MVPLTAACDGGHMNMIMDLLEAGADVNLQGESGTTPLTAAYEGGHMNVVKELLKAGADVNPQGKCNTTPLTAACEGGHMSVVKQLLEAGADVNLQGESGTTPLTAAYEGGHMSVVKQLLEAGADVNLQGEYDTTPLTAACEGGHTSVAEELIKMGVDVNMQNCAGKTPLYTLVLRNTETLKPFVPMLSSCGADPTISDGESLSALYIALVINNGDVVKQLLQNESKSQCNMLKLHLFDSLVNLRHSDVLTDSNDDVMLTRRRVWRIKKWGDLYETFRHSKYEIMKHLLDLGLDVNQWIQLYDDDQSDDVKPLLFTLIDEEYVSDRVEKVRILLEAGVDVNVRVRYSEYVSVLDREGVSNVSNEGDDVEEDSDLSSVLVEEIVSNDSRDEDDVQEDLDMKSVLDKKGVSALERTRLVSKFTKSDYWWKRDKVPEYKGVLSELKKHVRRYSM